MNVGNESEVVALATKKELVAVDSIGLEVVAGAAVLTVDDASYALTVEQVAELRRQVDSTHFGLL